MIIQTVKAEALIHEFRVSIPANDISEKVDSWLQEKAKTFKMDGFRPGKAPFHIVKSQYEGMAIERTLDKFVKDSVKKVTQDNKLNLAVDPNFSFDEYAFGKDFSFTISTESMPEFELKDFSSVSVEKLLFDISDDAVEKKIQKIAMDNLDFSPADEGHKIQNGNYIGFSMECEQDGKKIDSLTFPDAGGFVGDLDIDASLDVDKALLGHKSGEIVTFSRVLPSDFFDASLREKTISVKIEIKTVEIAKPYTVSQEFAESMGYKSLDELRDDTRKHLTQERESLVFLCHKRYLLDALSSEYSFDLPPTMVKSEFDLIWAQLQSELNQAREAGTLDLSEDRPEAELRAEYELLAARRVRLGILVAKIAKVNKLSVSSEELTSAIFREALRHPLGYKKIINFYQNNEQARERVMSSLLENNVVRFVLDRVNCKEVEVTKKQLVERIRAVLPDFKFDEDVDDEVEVEEAAPKAKKTTKAKKEKETEAA
jgi:trigger factor